jgi:hypothetical protein
VRQRTNCGFEFSACGAGAWERGIHFAVRDILGAVCYVGWFQNDAVGVRRANYGVKIELFGAIHGLDDLRGATALCLSFECLLEGFVDAPGPRSVAMATLLLARGTRAVSLATSAGVDRLLHRLLRWPHPRRLRVCAEACATGTRWA